jgi:hypothetical protein
MRFRPLLRAAAAPLALTVQRLAKPDRLAMLLGSPSGKVLAHELAG